MILVDLLFRIINRVKNNLKKVWILTFEYAGIAKVGGLGEVPANQAKNLADKFNLTVFIPSHGKIEELTGKKKADVTKVEEQKEKEKVLKEEPAKKEPTKPHLEKKDEKKEAVEKERKEVIVKRDMKEERQKQEW